jgi:hypothetical protein
VRCRRLGNPGAAADSPTDWSGFMYIGGGALVVIVIILLILFMRR